MNLAEKEQYLTEVLTRDEYRKFVEYMSNQNVSYIVEKLDDDFKVTLDDTPLTFWGEVLEVIRTV
jgi:hypothetical protein|tara:strand:+ start:202 stop:396 length:195 start_codon:yes stop_codon:yes gene_type:complete